MSEPPFANTPRQRIHLGETVDEAVARVEFLVSNRRRLGLLIGPSGCGKTAVLRHMAGNPPRGDDVTVIHAARLSLMGMASGDLWRELASVLVGGNRGGDARACWWQLNDFLRGQWADGGQYILLFDDVENGSLPVQTDLCRLLSSELPITVVLAVGQEAFGAVIAELRDRADLIIDLPAWTREQTQQFLQWSMERVGIEGDLFTETAIDALHAVSGGIARFVIQVAELALVAAAVDKGTRVEAGHVEQVACEIARARAA